jgi:dolichyl-phosphate beta-glucosyltransferase
MSPSPVTVVVPCYNEGLRLDGAAFESMLSDPDVGLLFVNDGSTDDTADRLAELAARSPGRMRVLSLESNAGKAEAVRRGMLEALRSSGVVGYLDADLATPPSEVLRLVEILRKTGARAVLGSRVRLLGRDIRRRALRHYLGRIFASGASLALRFPIYDTQCGAKLFRRTPELLAALEEPFHSRWFFDVELLGRLATPTAPGQDVSAAGIVEEPLLQWRDVAGSKIRFLDTLSAVTDLTRIAVQLEKRRARVRARRG